MKSSAADGPEPYRPNRLLANVYYEANRLDDAGIEALCPAYVELAEIDVRYRDDVLLGKGAVKEVCRTYDSRTKRWVAMARLREDRGAEFYDVFVHEGWLTSSLSHPNIIKVHDMGVDGDGRPFFTMDLKGNTTLADLTDPARGADRRTLLGVFLQVCDAVAYAHSRNIVHLDLKPENIQADAFGEVLVCDWGLGKMLGADDETHAGAAEYPETLPAFDNMTLVGEIKGSPGFMAPEQVIEGAAKDECTDIFALGCLLHFILTGHPPFTGEPEKILEDTARGRVVPPRRRYPRRHIPESLEAVVMKALARQPTERYATVRELREEIDHYLRGYATRAEHPGFFREARLFLRRNKTPTTVAALGLVALGVLGVLSVQRIDRQRDRADRLASKADTISSLYRSELTRSHQERVELAQQLAISANSLKNLGIFANPQKTVPEARQLATLALALDPDCTKAQYEKFSLDCIQMNFKEARTYDALGRRKNKFERTYVTLVANFPDYDFSEEKRPSPAELAKFIRASRAIGFPTCRSLMERIVSYDFAVRSDLADYEQVAAALVEFNNGGPRQTKVRYDAENAEFSLWADTDVHLLNPNGGSHTCLLRFLPIRTLKLDVRGLFDIADLHTLQVETIDLRGCRRLRLKRAVSLPSLRQIHIRPGQIDPRVLKRWIQSEVRFAVSKDGR